MPAASISSWEYRTAYGSFVFLLLAIVYGIGAGAAVAMYYDVVAGMDALEDTLTSVQFMLFLTAVLLSFFHLPRLMVDLKSKLWKQALVRGMVLAGPLMIYLGTEGLLSHWLWWGPISDTDRFHMLHHTVTAGTPLTLGYRLGLRRWWHPATFAAASPLSLRAWLATGTAVIVVAVVVGLLTGVVTPWVCGLTGSLGFVVMLFLWRAAD